LNDVAHALAEAARPIALQYFRQLAKELENKLDHGFDPVTIADKSIEREMRRVLAERRPDDGILEQVVSIGIQDSHWCKNMISCL
jgi:fructose-1,6-bisphosphatase/inositol monophosphatase family enzyme